MFTILGVTFSAGEYNGMPYNNVVFHASHKANDDNTVGSMICKVKFKRQNLNEYSNQDLIDMIGHELDFNGIPSKQKDNVTYTGYIGISSIK